MTVTWLPASAYGFLPERPCQVSHITQIWHLWANCKLDEVKRLQYFQIILPSVNISPDIVELKYVKEVSCANLRINTRRFCFHFNHLCTSLIFFTHNPMLRTTGPTPTGPTHRHVRGPARQAGTGAGTAESTCKPTNWASPCVLTPYWTVRVRGETGETNRLVPAHQRNGTAT